MTMTGIIDKPDDLKMVRKRGYWSDAVLGLKTIPDGRCRMYPLEGEDYATAQRRWHSAAYRRGVKIATRLSGDKSCLLIWEKRD